MAVGEKILMYRKRLGMSQDELAQKLLVSRQTISLWEKGQTVPTIDNLIRLKEIFGVSVDEILGFGQEEETVTLPQETYTFQYTRDELRAIDRIQRKTLYKSPALLVIVGILMLVASIKTSAPDVMIGFVIGMITCGILGYVKGFRAYNKYSKEWLEWIPQLRYEYSLFEESFYLRVYRENEMIRESKWSYDDIKSVRALGDWLMMQIGGESVILRKNDLNEDSAFYAYKKKKIDKPVSTPIPKKWKKISNVLVVASVLSIFGAVAVVNAVSSVNNLYEGNMWILFLFLPIPIACTVLAIVLQIKYRRYTGEIIVGLIITAFLCGFGSLSFILAEQYDYSDAPIVRAEQAIGIDLPAHKQIKTWDWTKDTQSSSRGKMYAMSDIYLYSSQAEEFEKQLPADERWLSVVPNDLMGITSPMFEYIAYDYILIYNLDTSECNAVPQSNGTYRFVNLFYRVESDQMYIVEYDMEFIK